MTEKTLFNRVPSSCPPDPEKEVPLHLMFGAFPAGSVVKTLPSNAGGTGSIPLRGTKIPQSLEPKHKAEQYCNKFKKFEWTLKMAHVQKKKS